MTSALLIVALVAAIGGLVSVRLWPPARGTELVRAVVTWLLVAVPSVVQLFWPPLLALWQRDAVAIRAGQWWRLLTAVVVQDGPGAGTASNLILLAAVALFAATALRGWWAAVLLGLFGVASNLIDVLSGAADGAGNSKVTLALAAMLAARAVVGHRRVNPLLIALPVVGIALLILGDNHGPAILLGFVVGLLPAPWWASVDAAGPAGSRPSRSRRPTH